MFYKDFHAKMLHDKTVTPIKSRLENELEVLEHVNEWIDSWQGASDIINVETILIPDPYEVQRFYCFRVWVR